MKIVISGYYGFGNLGDELILHNLIRFLSEHQSSLVVLSQNPEQTQALHQVRAVSRWNAGKLWTEMKSATVFISGGGGLIQDISGPWTPAYYLGLIALAQMLRNQTILLGQGFGPLQRYWNQRLAQSIICRADLVIPRDAESYFWCTQHGVKADRLFPGADLVWLMPAATEQTRESRWVVCLRADWLQGEIPDWVRELVRFAQKRDTTIRFVALGNRGDHVLLQKIQTDPEFVGCEFRLLSVEPGDFNTIQQAFARAELVISMRYHGLLLGALAGAAVTGLGRDEKIKHLLQALEQPELKICSPENDWDALCRALPKQQERAEQNAKRLQQTAQMGIQRVLDRLKAWA